MAAVRIETKVIKMDMKEFAEMQEKVLYRDETDKSHSMFMDMDDLDLWCTDCGVQQSSYKPSEKLKEPCPGKRA